jgi:hypothetical protein
VQIALLQYENYQFEKESKQLKKKTEISRSEAEGGKEVIESL